MTGVATFWAQPGLLSLALIIFVCGLTISPTLIAGYGLIERQAPADRRTEGMTWLGSAISVGVAGGSAAAGHIIDAAGPHWGYAFAAGCGAVAAVICLLGLRTLRAPAGPRSGQRRRRRPAISAQRPGRRSAAGRDSLTRERRFGNAYLTTVLGA